MESTDYWLEQLTRLAPYGAKYGKAPHKPILLFVLLDLAESGQLPLGDVWLTPEIAFQFGAYWSIVAHRRTQPPDARLPFHHLQTQGFWQAFTGTGEKSPHRLLTRFIRIDPEFRHAVGQAAFRSMARRVLIAKWFEPAERRALYEMFRMTVPSDDEISLDAQFSAARDAIEKGRETRFRQHVVAAYGYACALTGYRITTIDVGSIVDAAHIHQFSDSRNNDPKNGMALCKNAHWLFDVGLWSVGDDYRILVAKDAFSEESPDQKPLTEYHGSCLRLPTDPCLWPDPKRLAWHRKHKFLGAA